jgi:hypothetical protein
MVDRINGIYASELFIYTFNIYLRFNFCCTILMVGHAVYDQAYADWFDFWLQRAQVGSPDHKF